MKYRSKYTVSVTSTLILKEGEIYEVSEKINGVPTILIGGIHLHIFTKEINYYLTPLREENIDKILCD